MNLNQRLGLLVNIKLHASSIFLSLFCLLLQHSFALAVSQPQQVTPLALNSSYTDPLGTDGFDFSDDWYSCHNLEP